MFERITAGVVEQLSRYIGQGLHGGLRACNQAVFPSCMQIYNLLPLAEFGHWSQVCHACAWSAARFACGKHELKNSNTNRGRLSYLLAKAIMRATRRLATTPGEEVHKQVYAFFSEEMGMKALRAFVEPVTHDVISRMITPTEHCPDCTRNGKLEQTCDLCGQLKCAMHCDCMRASHATQEPVTMWRKRIGEFLYHLPDVEMIETSDDAPLDDGTLVFHTYDDDHPHFQVTVRPWRPDDVEDE